jgi:thiamine kinase-like enzyme
MTGALPSVSTSNEAATCHNDLNPWNILVTPEGWKTLDWEFVGRNDPLFDLVALHQGLQLDINTLPALATAFLPSCSAKRLTRAFAHFWLREWCWASYQLRQGNRREEIVEQEREAKQQLLVLPEF